MSEGYNGLPAYYGQSSNPITPNVGFALRGMDPIIAENFVLADTAIGTGGTSVKVNGSVINNPNFNGTIPAAPGGDTNVTFQVDINGNISAYVPVGTGTVTSFSAGNLSPIFTTSVATSTTTPALTFALTNAGGGTVFGNATASSAAPAYTTAPVLGIPGTSTGTIALASITASGLYTITAPASSATPTFTLPTSSGVGVNVADGTVFTATIAATGTLTLATQTANTVFAGPATGSAAAPTFRALVAADIPSGAVLWNNLGNASGNLTLSNGANTTEFDQTSNVAWLWKNTTTGTSGTTNASPLLELAANYYNGTSSAADTWTIGTSLAAGTNGLSTLTIAHSGSTAQATITLPPSATNVATPAVTFGTSTYGIGGSATSALNIYTTSGAGSIAITGIVAGTTRWQVGCGDSSQANDTFFLGTTVANWQMELTHAVTTSTTVPGIRFIDNGTTGTGHMAATSGAQVHASFEASFVPASGSASFACLRVQPTINQTSSSSGSYTGLLVNAIETSLKGSANKLLSLQAGTTGGTVKLDIANNGIVSTYNAIATVSNGVPSELATSDLTAKGAAITATTLYTTTVTGMYRVSWSATITTPDGVSSVLGGTNGFQVLYTSPTDSVVKTTVPGNSVTSSANTTGTAVGGCEVVYAKTGTNIQFTYGYTSATSGQMIYELHCKVEAL